MRKILFVLPRLTSGGAERQAVTIARIIKNLGNDVSFLCYSEGVFFEESLKEAGIPVTRKICNYLQRILFVTRYIRRGGYDVVISFLPTPNFLNCLAASWGKKWRVITSERSSVESSLLSRRGKLFASLQRFSDAIVCNSDNARKMWMRHYPQYEKKLKTIYNAVSLPELLVDYTPKRDARIHIVIAATIYKTKNPMGVLNALILMSQEERERIIIDWYGGAEAEIGNHTEYDKVVETIKEHELQSTILLHDATRDIANRMNEADFVGLFSQLEGLPNAICEAMTIGKPIIMSRCSDYNVLVEEGVNGFLCDWDNPESIKKALLLAAAVSSDALVKMGVYSKEKARVLFSPESVVEQWISLM